MSLNPTDEYAGIPLGQLYEQASQFSLALALYRQATGIQERPSDEGRHCTARLTCDVLQSLHALAGLGGVLDSYNSHLLANDKRDLLRQAQATQHQAVGYSKMRGMHFTWYFDPTTKTLNAGWDWARHTMH
jgi:hypothetical protein